MNKHKKATAKRTRHGSGKQNPPANAWRQSEHHVFGIRLNYLH